MKNILWYTLWLLKQSYLVTMFFKVMQYGYETLQNVNPLNASVALI